MSLWLPLSALAKNSTPIGLVTSPSLMLPQGGGKVTFAVLSDIHIGLFEPENTAKMYHYNRKILQDMITTLNARPDVDFVLVPGDLTKDSEPYNHIVAKMALDKLNCPYYVVPGNHDVKKSYMPKGNWGIKEFVKLYHGHGYQGSNSWYALDPAPGVHLVGLDSASDVRFYTTGGGRIPEQQLKWLDRDLAENENKTVIVMLHHCLIEHPDGPAYWMCDNADQIKQILKRHSVKVIITGHTHITEIKEEGGLYEINCPATCSYPCAYRVLKLSDRKLEINTVWYSNEAIRQIAKREYITALWNKMRGELAIAEGKACDRHAVIEVVDRAAILPAASVNFNPAKPNSSKAIEGAP